MLNGHTPTFLREDPGASATHTAVQIKKIEYLEGKSMR